MKFTDTGIRNLKPKTERYVVWKDGGDGLGLRVTPQGRKTWVTMYRFQGKARMMTHGIYPTISLKRAGQLHADALAKLDLDPPVDPGAEKVAERKAERAAETVADLIDEYIERHAKAKKRSWAEDQRMLDKDVKPAWGKRKAKNVTRRDVIRLLDGIADRGAPVAANRTYAVLSKMFRFAVRRGILETSPVFEIDRPGGEEAPRARALDADEIRTVWQALDRPDSDEHPIRATLPLKLALKLLLVTAQRRGELAQARRDEFDLERGAWLIPAEHSKNGAAHAVPLTPLAVKLVRKLMECAGDSAYLLPSPRANDENDIPITERAITRAVSNNRAAFGIPHWTPHDLRRTATTMMKRRTGETWERVLNHLPEKLHRTYDVHDPWAYFDEKRTALQAWEARLVAILEGREAKVLPMARPEVTA